MRLLCELEEILVWVKVEGKKFYERERVEMMEWEGIAGDMVFWEVYRWNSRVVKIVSFVIRNRMNFLGFYVFVYIILGNFFDFFVFRFCYL